MQITPSDLAVKIRTYGLTFKPGSTAAGWMEQAAEYLACLAAIHAVLDGREWDSSTTSTIAEILEVGGLEVAAADTEISEA